MARYKHIDTSPRFLAVDLARQLLPGTLEHALNHLLDHELDLSGFDGRFCNNETGATAYPPGMLLKVVLFAYSRGIVSSRGIERACREHVTFVALCGDSGPHFTTIAHFVSTLGEDIAHVFAAVLAICDRQGLLGREMFAIEWREAAQQSGQEAVDSKQQIIVSAKAHGTGSEQEVLLPVVVELKPLLAADSLLTADAGYHSEASLQQLAACQIDALIADNGMRTRDERGGVSPTRNRC